MTMSVKMLNDIAVHAEGLASEAVAIRLANSAEAFINYAMSLIE